MSATLATLPWLSLHGLATVLAVLLYAVTSHATRQRRHPAAAIAWMLFLLLVPYLAVPLYLAFGSRKLPRPRQSAWPWPAGAPEGDWVTQTLQALGQGPPADYAALHLHADGTAARQALFACIAQAQATIDVCTFLVGRDQLGQEVLQALADRARAGLRVRLLIDGLGHWMGGAPALGRLRAAGAEVALFAPPLRPPLKGRSNLRNHRKLLVADAGTAHERLWLGGRNLAGEYFTGGRAGPAWRDLSLDLRGTLVRHAAALFERDWAFAHGRPGAEAVAPAAPAGADGAQLVASGPDQADDTFYLLLVAACYRARARIRLCTPYFVPEPALLMALCLAARRGVAVDLLMPAKSNHRLSDLARSRGLRALAQAGARVWLLPQMHHAKLALFDGDLALTGSANLDSRSLFLNYESMLALRKAADVARLADWFDAECAPARPYVARAPGFAQDVAEGMLLWLAFQL